MPAMTYTELVDMAQVCALNARTMRDRDAVRELWTMALEYQQRACVLQAENRKRFEEAFARGLAVIDFRTDAEGNGIFGLGRWQEPTSP